jgi:hypothetical protein
MTKWSFLDSLLFDRHISFSILPNTLLPGEFKSSHTSLRTRRVKQSIQVRQIALLRTSQLLAMMINPNPKMKMKDCPSRHSYQ